MQQFTKMPKVVVQVFITILILWGCTGTVPNPTLPATAPYQGELTVIQSTAKVIRGDDPARKVQSSETLKVEANDRIELDENGRGILRFHNLLEAELIQSVNLLLSEIKQESGGSAEVTWTLDQGHIFLRLDGTSIAHVTIETPYATIKTLEDDTELDLCQTKDLSCVWVKNGSAEVIGQGQRQIVKAGEASFIEKDLSPSMAICAPLATFRAWEENFRVSADTSTLGDLIAGSPQEPCVPVTGHVTNAEATEDVEPTPTLEQPTVMATQAEMSETPVQESVDPPSNAHILYQDDFTNSSSGWPQMKIDNSSVGYSGTGDYLIQITGSNSKYSVYIPDKKKYENVNIDLKVSTESAGSGDFHYGLSFRRSGDQYYLFTISPGTRKWSVLKSSVDALKTLREGTDDSIQGMKTSHTLRVSADGTTFSLFINGRLVDQFTDPDYASGEIGLFVQTRDSANVRIRFDSITVWDTRVPSAGSTPLSKEACFNNKDDDGDGLIDKADRDCVRPASTPTPQPTKVTPSYP